MKSKTYVRLIMFAIFAVTMNVHAKNDAEAGEKAAVRTIHPVKVGDAAPDFSVKMLDGHLFKLSEMKGKVVLLNFWATWCSPCMMEFKEIPEKILKRFEGRPDFVFIPVSRGETHETVRDKMNRLKESGIDFPAGIDPDKAVYNLYAERYIPRNYLIDRNGTVVFTSVGYDEKAFAELADMIEELLK